MESSNSKFNGLAISDLVNQIHTINIENESITVHQNISSSSPHCKIVEFTFEMENPTRFRLDVLLPDDIVNACVTLNAQVLIGLFSTVLPDDCEVPEPSVCNGNHEPNHEKISTLVPGKFQSINFRWINSDILKFHLFYV